MADDSWDIQSVMDFHPCDKPYGMKDYVLQDLTHHQQLKLNIRKRQEIRSNQRYLAKHPEIRGLIIMILRILMKTKPKYDIYEAIGQYFTKSSVDLKEEIYNYLEERDEILGVNSTILQEETKEDEQLSYYSVEGEDSFIKEELEKLIAAADIDQLDTAMYEKEEFEEFEGRRGSKKEKGAEEKDDESVSSGVKVSHEILEGILETVFEEADVISLGDIASVGYPIDYEDHAIASVHSDDSDDDDDDRPSVAPSDADSANNDDD